MTYTIDQFGPDDLLSTTKEGKRRVKVDPGNTAFYEGREYRAFKEFDIPQGASEAIKVTATGDTIVQLFGASLVLGSLRIELVQGGEDGDDFAGSLPIYPANKTSLAPAVTTGVTMQNGGTHTGGDIVDLILLVAGSPAKQAKEITANEERLLGFSAGTFYIRLASNGSANAKGVFRARWEEI